MSPSSPLPEKFRLAEILAALSLATDLARGHPDDEAIRACLIATRLAASMRVEGEELAAVYYATLIRFVGCTSTSHDYSRDLDGDDIAVRRGGDMIDATNPREALSFVLGLTHGSGVSRLAAAARAMPRAKRVAEEAARAHCDVGARMAQRLGLGDAVERALYDMFERWDGRGPHSLRGPAIAAPARFAAVAFTAVMFEPLGTAGVTVDRWAGGILDPAIAGEFLRSGLLDASREEDPWPAVLDAEPGPSRTIGDDDLDGIARAFADVIDLKSPYFHGHSPAVASLAEGAAGATKVDPLMMRRAGLLHDLGRVGVPTGVWEKPGPLTRAEWEQVRLHAYQSERILERSPVLGPIGAVAGRHHERLDATGYHRGAGAAALSVPARLLAAADVYAALTQDRPHRPALPEEAAARTLGQEAAAGRLDPDAVAAVLAAVGRPVPGSIAPRPGGLTDREVEVVRLVARGMTEKEIARALAISKPTVHTHVTHVYAKIRVSSHAGVTLFALENGLVGPREP